MKKKKVKNINKLSRKKTTDVTFTIDLLSLREWFLENKRAFPWRKNPNSYQVWISEVMLQQTRASYVVAYYQRWLKKYPTLSSLAKAPLAEVIKMFEGLGYYSRVRSLHKGAQKVMEKWGGNLPQEKKELLEIPGIGSYTAGAIMLFAFQKKAPAVDANVLRILARYFAIKKEISSSQVKKELEEIEEGLLPDKDPHIIGEALIELGALVCQKEPKCERCPLQKTCKGFALSLEKTLPMNQKKKRPITFLKRAVFVFRYKKEEKELFMIGKVPKGQVLADLHIFPYLPFEEEKNEETMGKEKKDLLWWEKEIFTHWKIEGVGQTALLPVDQSYTRYQLTLYPFVVNVLEKYERPGFFWASKEEIDHLPFSSGDSKILKQFIKEKKGIRR